MAINSTRTDVNDSGHVVKNANLSGIIDEFSGFFSSITKTTEPSSQINTQGTGAVTYSTTLPIFRGGLHTFNMIDNYIYFYHLNKFMLIPAYPDTVTDTTAIQFSASTPLSRSAPIYSFANAGPRDVGFELHLHRDMMQDINYNRSNYVLNSLGGQLDDDYVDALIKELQAAAYPQYEAATKTVKPPIIAVRFGAEIFCKGVVAGNVRVTYGGPLLEYASGEKYAEAKIGFQIHEIDPYSAEMVMVNGSFRGLDNTLEKGLFKVTDMSGKGNRATSADIVRGG